MALFVLHREHGGNMHVPAEDANANPSCRRREQRSQQRTALLVVQFVLPGVAEIVAEARLVDHPALVGVYQACPGVQNRHC